MIIIRERVKKRVRIAIFAPKYFTRPANAATHLVVLQRQTWAWTKLGHDVLMLAEVGKHDLALPENLTIYPVKGLLSSLSHLVSANRRQVHNFSSLFSPDLPFHAARQLKKLDADVIYSCGTSFMASVMALLGCLTGLPTVHYVIHYTRPWKWWRVYPDTFQGYKVPWRYIIAEALKNCIHQPLRLESIHRWGLRRCTRVIAGSQDVKDSLVQAGMDGAQIPVVYPQVDIPPSDGTKRVGAPVVTYMGHLHQGRGVLDLVKAFVLVRERHPEAKLLIAASNVNELTERYFRELVAEHNLASSINRIGVVDDLIKKVIMPATVIVLPYRDLPSIKLLEAMACGRPVVTTDIGWANEVITDGENGFLVTPGDIEGLADRIDSVLSGPELAVKMGGKARETIRAHYADNSTILDILQQVSAHRGSKQPSTPMEKA